MEPTAVIDSLALLYLACAQMTDDHLDDKELFEIHRQLGRLFPDHAAAELEERFAGVASRFWSMLPQREALRASVDAEARALAQHHRGARLEEFLRGLIAVTKADGRVLDAEREWVARTAEIFGIDGQAIASQPPEIQRAPDSEAE